MAGWCSSIPTNVGPYTSPTNTGVLHPVNLWNSKQSKMRSILVWPLVLTYQGKTCRQHSKEGSYKPELPKEKPPQLSNNSEGQMLQIIGTVYHKICLPRMRSTHSSNINRLEMVQERAARFVRSDHSRTSSVITAMLSDLLWNIF